MNNEQHKRIPSYSIEICSMIPCCWEENSVLVMSIRMPSFGYKMFPLMLTTDQVLRLRDSLDAFLNNPKGWLYMPPEIREHFKAWNEIAQENPDTAVSKENRVSDVDRILEYLSGPDDSEDDEADDSGETEDEGDMSLAMRCLDAELPGGRQLAAVTTVEGHYKRDMYFYQTENGEFYVEIHVTVHGEPQPRERMWLYDEELRKIAEVMQTLPPRTATRGIDWDDIEEGGEP